MITPPSPLYRDADNLPVCDEDAFACQLARADIYWDEDSDPDWLAIDNVNFNTMAESLGKVMVVCYLFYQILATLTTIVADITGSIKTPMSAIAGGGRNLMGKGGHMASKAGEGALSGARKAGDTALGGVSKGVKAIHNKRKNPGGP